jgi:protein gp37
VGVSVTNTAQFIQAHKYLVPPLKASVKFISFEPVLERITYPITSKYRPLGYPIEIPLSECCDWIILGQQTPVSAKTTPKIEWIQEILVAAHNANIPVFTKNNLQSLLVGEWSGWNLRQEFPMNKSQEKL